MHVSITGSNIGKGVIALVGHWGLVIEFFFPERFYIEWFFFYFCGGKDSTSSPSNGPPLIMILPVFIVL